MAAPADQRFATSEAPPLLAIEIVSPTETWTELYAKVRDHLAMGVGTVIVADPRSQSVMVASQTKPLHDLSRPLLVEIEVPGQGTLPLDFDDIYNQLR